MSTLNSKNGTQSRRASTSGGEAAEASVLGEFTPEVQKRIMRRVDIRVVATVGLLYCFSVIDRSNLPSAAVAGMTEDLGLIGNRYVSHVNGQVLDSLEFVSDLNKSIGDVNSNVNFNKVDYQSCLLHDIYYLSANFNHTRSDHWPKSIFHRRHNDLRVCCHRHGLPQTLGPDGCSESHSWGS